MILTSGYRTMYSNVRYTDLSFSIRLILFSEKIKQSLGTVRSFQQAVFGECAASEARTKALDSDLRDAKEHLRSRRTALASVRREILRRLHESGGVFAGAPVSGNAPPTYMREPEVGSRTLDPSQAPRHTTNSGNELIVEPPEYESSPSPHPPSLSQERRSPGLFSSSPPSMSRTASTSTNNGEPTFAPPPGPPPNRAPSLAGTPTDGVGGFVDPRVPTVRSRSHSPFGSPSDSAMGYAHPSMNMPMPNVGPFSPRPSSVPASSDQPPVPPAEDRQHGAMHPSLGNGPDPFSWSPRMPSPPRAIVHQEASSSVVAPPSTSKNPFLAQSYSMTGHERATPLPSYGEDNNSVPTGTQGSFTSHNPFRSPQDHQTPHPDSK